MGKVKDIVVKAGETFDIRIPYEGYPPPTADWIRVDALGDAKNVSDADSRVMQKVSTRPFIET